METLTHLAKDWEMMIFTASSHQYAAKIIDQIDPKGELFTSRLYKEHCYPIDNRVGMCIKDLRILDRRLDQVVLVDDNSLSFVFQPANGIPILPFKGDPNDLELLLLREYLDFLLLTSSVTKTNQEHFRLNAYLENNTIKEIMRNLFKGD